MQRGRRSAASVATFPVIEQWLRLDPPQTLSKQERELFIELAAQAGHLKAVDIPLLAALAQSILLARKLARDPGKAKEWDRTVRTQMTLTRSLRMTPQSRIDARAAGRHDPPQGSAPWD